MLLDLYSMEYTAYVAPSDLVVATYFNMYVCAQPHNNHKGTLVNWALASNGGVASASSTANASFIPAYMNDDQTGTFWNDGTSGAFPDVAIITFAGPRTIQQIDFYTPNGNGPTPSFPEVSVVGRAGFVTSFVVDYYNGSAWVNISTVTNNNKLHVSFSFAPVTATQVRITVNDADRSDSNSADNYYSRISEIQAWGVSI